MFRLPIEVVRERHQAQTSILGNVSALRDEDDRAATSGLDLEETIAYNSQQRVEEVHLAPDIEQGDKCDEHANGEARPESHGVDCKERDQVGRNVCEHISVTALV